MPPPSSGMSTRDIVEAMVQAINSGRAERVVERMVQDGAFIDSLGRRIEGRAALYEAWRGYCRLFPDYRIEVEGMIDDGLEAMLYGRAGATLHRDGRPVADGGWQLPAAWRAVSDGARRLRIWQVFADTQPVARLLAP